MTLADMQLLDDAMDGEKALRVKWHAHVKQARADMERVRASVSSTVVDNGFSAPCKPHGEILATASVLIPGA